MLTIILINIPIVFSAFKWGSFPNLVMGSGCGLPALFELAQAWSQSQSPSRGLVKALSFEWHVQSIGCPHGPAEFTWIVRLVCRIIWLDSTQSSFSWLHSSKSSSASASKCRKNCGREFLILDYKQTIVMILLRAPRHWTGLVTV